MEKKKFNPKEYMKVTGGGGSFYRWLLRNNFPKGFRVLCMNCNHSLGRRKYNGNTKTD